jgi:hypothetical protein
MCIFYGLPFRRFRSQVPVPGSGRSPKIIGGVRELLGDRQPTFRLLGGRYTLHCVSGGSTGSLWGPLKKLLESKMGKAGVFSGSYLPMGRRCSFYTARLPVIGHSALPPFLFPGARQVRSRGKVLVGLGNGGRIKFLCAIGTPP